MTSIFMGPYVSPEGTPFMYKKGISPQQINKLLHSSVVYSDAHNTMMNRDTASGFAMNIKQ